MEWTKKINLLRISQNCLGRGLSIPQTLLFQTERLTAMRLGFGNLDEAEMTAALDALERGVTEEG